MAGESRELSEPLAGGHAPPAALHRVADPAPLESASLTVDEVAEAAAVPVIDDVCGRAVEMDTSLKPGVQDGA